MGTSKSKERVRIIGGSYKQSHRTRGRIADWQVCVKALAIRLKVTGCGGFAQAVRDALAGDGLTVELMDAMPSALSAGTAL